MASLEQDKSGVISNNVLVDQISEEATRDVKGATADDQADMFRLGKVQQLRRDFRLASIIGFSMLLMASWEVALSTAILGLSDGGSAGLIWISLICWVIFLLINISMAEMGSMAPTSGGQYHWISEFAPPKYQKPLSYFMGWLCVLGWQSCGAAAAYTAALEIVGLAVLNSPSYSPEKWHTTLLTIAIAASAVVFNVFLARKLPLIESLMLIIHMGAWIGILVTLWVLAPLSDTSVFTTFTDAGWHSFGASSIIGILSGLNPLVGGDAAVHMSEELKDAGKILPRSMIFSTVVNGAMSWIMVVTLCFCLGDLSNVLASPTGIPFIQVFYNATDSKAAATAMTVFVVIPIMCSNLTAASTASRQMFAFARDKGLPFSPQLAKVTWDLPLNSLIVTFFTSSLISLIAIGSETALNSITSLAMVAFLSSYFCSISCVIWRRFSGIPLPKSKFSLGKWGLPINITAIVLLAPVFILAFFPTVPNPDAATMNWSIMIYAAVLIISLVYYIFRGRHQYEGPVMYIRKVD